MQTFEQQLAAIKAVPVAGNAHHDMPLMMQIDAFARSEAPLELKCDALEYMEVTVMGCRSTRSITGDALYLQMYLEL